MLVLLESKPDIASAQKKLIATFSKEFPNRETRDISHPGGTNHDAKILTNGTYWYWPGDAGKSPSPRRLNWLGIYEANQKFDLRISVEVNTPVEGRNDRVSGFFARDSESGAVYLLHSGRVGGGAKGVGKEAFLAWRNEPLEKVIDSAGDVRFGVPVMPVEGHGATRSACRYIGIVARFKDAVKAGEMHTPRFKEQQDGLGEFYSESRGRRKGKRSSVIDYLSRHGEIVDAVRAWRVARGLPTGTKVVKSMLIDLGVSVAGELVEIYEVKTSVTRGDVYTAIGQVLVHANAAKCRRTIVVPHDEVMANDLARALHRLDINLLRCKLDSRRAVILS
jgi:hypothetical protein